MSRVYIHGHYVHFNFSPNFANRLRNASTARVLLVFVELLLACIHVQCSVFFISSHLHCVWHARADSTNVYREYLSLLSAPLTPPAPDESTNQITPNQPRQQQTGRAS